MSLDPIKTPAAYLGRSMIQQQDVLAYLLSFARLREVFLFAEYKGDPESDVDAALAAGRTRRPRGTELPGLAILVAQPSELPDPKKASAGVLIGMRTFPIRIIEAPKINRASGGTQLDADTAKDLVKQRLHGRFLGRAQLSWAETQPWYDKKGGYGWTVFFDILDDLPSEPRAAVPLMEFANGLCTLTGAGTAGEVLYYTLDGSLPYPHDDTLADTGPNGGGIPYAAPFAVESGTRVRAICTEPNKEQGNVREGVAP